MAMLDHWNLKEEGSKGGGGIGIWFGFRKKDEAKGEGEDSKFNMSF